MNTDTTQFNEQSKYPIGGYAPGSYLCNCTTCGERFTGDKRAVQCEPCAIKMTTPPPGTDDMISIDALLSEFKRQGFDTSNWDGDEGAAKAIVDGVKNHITEQRVSGEGLHRWVKARKDDKEYFPVSWHLVPVRFIHTKAPILDIEAQLAKRPKSLPHIIEWLEPLPASEGKMFSMEDMGKSWNAGYDRCGFEINPKLFNREPLTRGRYIETLNRNRQ